MTPEEIKEYNENSRKEFERGNINGYLGYLIPFILFWIGMLTPVFTDNVLVWTFSLVPFYAYSFILAAAYSNDKTDESVIAPASLSFVTSVCLAILLFIVPENWTTINTICTMGFVNVFGSLFYLFFLALETSTNVSFGMFLGPLFLMFHDNKKG